jgi:ABC-2 type transport system permease protein
MTFKEFLQLKRDWMLLVFIVYAFTADIYLAGSGVSLKLREAVLFFMDQDKSTASRELIYRFQPPNFHLAGEITEGPRKALQLLDEGDAMVVLDIGADFERELITGTSARIQMQIDTSNSVQGFLASSYAQRIVADYGTETAMTRLKALGGGSGSLPRIIDDHRVWFNANQNDTWFMSITELLTIITLFSVLLPAAAMVREKERGTVEQLLVSPLSSFQIMFPKVLSMTTVILIGCAISLALVLRGIFHVPIRGSLPLFFAITTLFVFTTAGLGLFISTIARNLAQVGMMTILVFTPMLFLSGAWTPPEAMPFWMRMVMYASPLHYYIDTGFGILLKGAGVDILWNEILIMGILGGVIFGVGMARFRKQFGN